MIKLILIAALFVVILLFLERDKKNQKKIKELSEMAFKDPLTSLLNRRSFCYELNTIKGFFGSESYGKRRSSVFQSLGIIILDADHFKSVNDEFGHAVGDVVLQTIADTIRKVFRTADLMCRWGGEEFIIALPNIDQVKLVFLAEKLRSDIEALEYEIPELRTTISVGLAHTTENLSDIDRFIDLADQAMYKAKNTGRNKVVASWE